MRERRLISADTCPRAINEGDPSVDERCGVGVAELVWGDVSDPSGLGAAGSSSHRVWESHDRGG